MKQKIYVFIYLFADMCNVNELLTLKKTKVSLGGLPTFKRGSRFTSVRVRTNIMGNYLGNNLCQI